MHEIELLTNDARPIGATWFPNQEKPDAGKVVLIAGATAVPQGFYRRFALAMNARGYHALSFDYRGIGRSAPKQLKGYVANYRDWGERDAAAAFDFAAQHGEVYLAGHSFAGHAVGMLPQASKLKAAWLCGSGAGYSGHMTPLERVKAELVWHVLTPIPVALLGYGPMRWFGIGENIPLGVYRDWKRWCSMPHYFFDDPKLVGSDFIERFQRLQIPMQWLNASDDAWAQARSRDAFMRGYRSAIHESIDLQPAEFGVKAITHMGYFRANLAPLWQRAADYFDRFA